MYKMAVRWMIRRNVRAIAAGDVAPALAAYADDAVLVFPGDGIWAGEHRGRAAIEQFLRRFVEAGIVGETHEILVSGPPWNTKICVRFTDFARDGDKVVYENRAILFGLAKWGKIVYQEDYEDTQKAAAFDAYLAAKGAPVDFK